MLPMLIDATPFSADAEGGATNIRDRALGSVVKLIEEKLGVFVGYNARNLPYERPDLRDAFALAGILQKKGIMRSLNREVLLPDEPHMYMWRAICNEATSHHAGGASLRSDHDALLAALAECLERYIWYSQKDYFVSSLRAKTSEMRARGDAVLPERFSGFNDEQRKLRPGRMLTDDSEFLWIQGTSLASSKKIYVPAQTVSSAWVSSPEGKKEPSIRNTNTIGLATWPTSAGARLAGALEVIEREAYMVMWLNQLTLPRIAFAPLAETSAALTQFAKSCERYRLRPHIIKLLTDAPTHAVCVIIEDLSATAPRFTFGLKAHRSLIQAVEKASSEALRARTGVRWHFSSKNVWDATMPVKDIGHRERLYYWAIPENATRLEFLISGKEENAELTAWDKDSEEQHLSRIVSWCKASGFEIVSVPLTTSAVNPTPLHIEMMVLPELQNVYLGEPVQAFGGTRWKDVPEKLGYKARKTPFADAPHPFS